MVNQMNSILNNMFQNLQNAGKAILKDYLLNHSETFFHTTRITEIFRVVKPQVLLRLWRK